MLVYLATKNGGKARELRQILAPYGWELLLLRDYREVDETGTTYAQNAALKARALRAQLDAAGNGEPALADDSGLEIAALGGRPGVRSARYGAPEFSWSDRRQALLGEVARAGIQDRTARFVCALHLVRGDGSEASATGILDGHIAQHERGTGGFGYDPIFELADGRTLAELGASEKNALSHRARAARALASLINDA